MSQPLLWLLSGALLGSGIVTAFNGGGFLLLAGITLAVILAIRFRHALRGWSGLPYGLGATVALLLLPYVIHPLRCTRGSPAGCYQAATVGTFVGGLLVAMVALGLAVLELRSGRRR